MTCSRLAFLMGEGSSPQSIATAPERMPTRVEPKKMTPRRKLHTGWTCLGLNYKFVRWPHLDKIMNAWDELIDTLMDSDMNSFYSQIMNLCDGHIRACIIIYWPPAFYNKKPAKCMDNTSSYSSMLWPFHLRTAHPPNTVWARKSSCCPCPTHSHQKSGAKKGWRGLRRGGVVAASAQDFLVSSFTSIRQKGSDVFLHGRDPKKYKQRS
jgi:hypothetical protein